VRDCGKVGYDREEAIEGKETVSKSPSRRSKEGGFLGAGTPWESRKEGFYHNGRVIIGPGERREGSNKCRRGG